MHCIVTNAWSKKKTSRKIKDKKHEEHVDWPSFFYINNVITHRSYRKAKKALKEMFCHQNFWRWDIPRFKTTKETCYYQYEGDMCTFWKKVKKTSNFLINKNQLNVNEKNDICTSIYVESKRFFFDAIHLVYILVV